MNLSVGPDRYTRIARLQPALLVVLPAALAVLAWFPDLRLGAVFAMVTACGGTYLMAQVARAWGKSREPELFERLGGHPTVRRLKQLDAPNRASLERWRHRIQELLPDQALPTPEQERDDPHGVDQIYSSIVQFLIERTRDRTKFELLFHENCQYGFARNLWAMKPLAFGIAVIALTGIAVRGVIQFRATGTEPLTVVTGLAVLVLLLVWIFVVTPEWVRVPSEAYADRLVASLDSL